MNIKIGRSVGLFLCLKPCVFKKVALRLLGFEIAGVKVFAVKNA